MSDFLPSQIIGLLLCTALMACSTPNNVPLAKPPLEISFGTLDSEDETDLDAVGSQADDSVFSATDGAGVTSPDGAGLGDDSVSIDDGVSVDAGCKEGEKVCLDATTAKFCHDGTWYNAAPCSKGKQCNKGTCTCSEECLAINQLQCLDKIAAFKICKLSDGCLNWSIPVACQPGQVCQGGVCKLPDPAGCKPVCAAGQACQNGVCVQSGCTPSCPAGHTCQANKCVAKAQGTLTCGQIFACVDQFAISPKDKVNIDACIAKGTASGQALYTKRKACIALSCQTYIDQGKVNDAMLCVYTFCGQEQADCLGSGKGDCNELAGCIVGCSNNGLCLIGCHSDASLQGAKNFYALQSCADQKCPGLAGSDWNSCMQQGCTSALNKCVPSQGQTTLSCAQIMSCASGCKDKPCAQACKTKGSIQGLSDLQKLLDCNDKHCKLFCEQGTQQQCDACLAVYCKAESKACQM